MPVTEYVPQALPSDNPTPEEVWARAKSDPQIFRRLLVRDGWRPCFGWSGGGGGWMTQKGSCDHTAHHVIEKHIVRTGMVGR